MTLHCTVTYFTRGGRDENECGDTDECVQCSQCGCVYCHAHQVNTPVFNVNGKPVCEQCAYPDCDYPYWEVQ